MLIKVVDLWGNILKDLNSSKLTELIFYIFFFNI